MGVISKNIQPVTLPGVFAILRSIADPCIKNNVVVIILIAEMPNQPVGQLQFALRKRMAFYANKKNFCILNRQVMGA